MAINSKNFQFDDERGNNFNITVNHYHMAPQNPMSNLLNVMGQTAMMMSLMNGNNDNSLLEDNTRNISSRNEVLIEDKSMNGFSYEIIDEPEFDFIIKKMYDKNDYKVIEIGFQKPITIDTFEKFYRNLCKSVQYKLTTVSDKTNKFIFTFEIISIGTITCAYIENNFFECMVKKFSNGKNNISFKHKIAEKLSVPFLESLSHIDYIIDLDGIFHINFEAIDGKYHIRKESGTLGF